MNITGLYDCKYRIINNKPIIFLFIRNKDGTKTIKEISDFKPYFWIKRDLAYKIPSKYLVVPESKKTIYGDEVVKVELNKPNEVYYLRSEFDIKDTFSTDVLFNLRFMIDKVDKIIPTKYRVCTLDIETTSISGWPNYLNAVESITCISLYDNFLDKTITWVWREDLEKKEEEVEDGKIFYYNTEREMLETFLDHFHKISPDILTGWNVISFDFKYLLKRMELLNIDYSRLSCVYDRKFDIIQHKETGEMLNTPVLFRTKGEPECLGCVLFDNLIAYKRLSFGELVSFSLSNIAQKELGEEKDKMINTGEVWKTDLSKLINYNRHDVFLTRKIEEKRKLISLFDKVRVFAGLANLQDCFFMSRLHDINILRKFKDKYVFPTKPPFTERTAEEKLQGATVESSPGLYYNIAALDYSGLYPNIIRSFNLSPEQISNTEKGTLINGVRIKQDNMGIYPSIIDDLLQLKKDLKEQSKDTGQDMRSAMFVVKIFINSSWGCFALKSFRLYDARLANSVTWLGRYMLQQATDIIEKEFKYKIVIKDTDSCYIQIPIKMNAAEEGIKIRNRINEFLDIHIKEKFKVRENTIKIEFEESFSRLFVQKKKHYAGRIDFENGKVTDRITLAGLSSKRSDTSNHGKKVQTESLNILLKEENYKQKIIAYIKQEVSNTINNKISYEDLAIPTKLNKEPNEYVRTDKKSGKKVQQNRPVIRGSKWSNKNLGTHFRSGTKFLLLYINHPETDCVCFEDEESIKELKIDYEKMIEKNILQKIKPIFEVMKWNKELNDIVNYSKNKLSGQQLLSL